jgi:hypothetical protein
VLFRFVIVRSSTTEELEVSREIGVEGLHALQLWLRFRKRRTAYPLGHECRERKNINAGLAVCLSTSSHACNQQRLSSTSPYLEKIKEETGNPHFMRTS